MLTRLVRTAVANPATSSDALLFIAEGAEELAASPRLLPAEADDLLRLAAAVADLAPSRA